MLRLSANISTLFTDRPFLDRPAAARNAGFTAIECQFPYEHSPEALAEALKTTGLELVLHNLPAGNWAAGERGIACHPGRVDEFREGVEVALRYARALGVPRLNCLAGVRPLDVPHELAWRTLVSNLKFAASALAASGLTLLVEPINHFDIPGFLLNRTDQGLHLLDEVGMDNAKLQYDVYHAQRMEGELCGTLERHMHRIGHVQIADNPGRAEPGTGEIRFAHILAFLDRLGYDGHVGCEYFPADKGPHGTEKGLSWLAAHGLSATGAMLGEAA